MYDNHKTIRSCKIHGLQSVKMSQNNIYYLYINYVYFLPYDVLM